MAIHRYLGLAAMVFLALAAITGSILCFAQPLDEALNADLFQQGRSTNPVDPVIAVGRFAALHPNIQVLSAPVRVARDQTISITVTAAPGKEPLKHDQIFLDRTNGREIGGRLMSPGWNRRQIVAGIAEFHYNLLAGDWGRWLMGAMALGWLISNFVGFYLTLPERRPFWKSWKRAWRFSFRSAFARLMLDIHRASGLWLLIGVTILALTSVALNFYSEAYEPTVVKISPLKRSLFDQPAPFPEGASPDLTYDDALRLARNEAIRKELDWLPATVLYRPDWNLYGVTFTDNGNLNYHRLGPIYYYFNANTGAFIHEVNPYNDSAGLVMIRMLYPLHSGKIAGTVTIIIVFVLGMATLEMCVTGAYLWWKRRKLRRGGGAKRKSLMPGSNNI
ncbi:MAG: PepSY-associated TM helix domain-containing protein [Sphingobium sp.]